VTFVRRRAVVVCVLGLLVVPACSRGGDVPTVAAPTAPAVAAPSPHAEQSPRPQPQPTPTPTPTPRPVVEIPLRLASAAGDIPADDFANFTAAVLTDPRGWSRAGFVFRFTPDATYTVVVAEGDEVDRLCLPYDTGGSYSCQNGPTVALNADRWRLATDTWPGSLEEYRTMLVNHEVGHLLGQHHPEQRCTRPGRRAAVMAQQSARLDGCAPNPWPLRWEIECAAKHLEPLAPGYEESPTPLCGPGDVRR
jgi:hypothetical protein